MLADRGARMTTAFAALISGSLLMSAFFLLAIVMALERIAEALERIAEGRRTIKVDVRR